MAVFCNKCGKDLLEQSRFCPFCGVVSKRTVDGAIAFVEPEQGPFCPACGKRTMEESKHCMWCGLEVHARPEGAGALLCPQCGEKNPEDAGFCSRCRMDFGKWFLGSASEARILGGRYRLDEELGRGGMGVVYRGFDVKLEMDVAVKMVPSELAKNKRAVGQLKKEAKIAIQLTHPNINRLYTFEEEGQEAYLVMEYVDGRTLDEIIEEREVLPERMVLEFGLAIIEGLAEAHKRGVIHRDLKPANIMVSEQGEVKILDFGIARVIKDTMTRLSTRAVSSSGTLLYMAPEQIKGMRETVRTDLYAFGAMMYELLSGEPPFCRGAIEHQIVNENPRALEGVSPWLNDVVLRCLSKEPERRYAGAKELAAALKGGGSGGRRQAPVASPPVPRSSAPVAQERSASGGISAEVAQKRKKLILFGGLALALVLVGTLGWYVGVAMPRAADEEACKLVKNAESKAGWQAYLAERPEGLCAARAKEGLAAIEKREDEAACGGARKANSEAGWKEYARERPDGSCKKEAEKRLAELAAAEREGLAKLEAERKAAEDDAKRKSAEQEARRKAAEEDAKRKSAEQEARRKAAEERERKVAEELARLYIRQPGSKLYWLRCPVGQDWTGTACKGKAKEMNWNQAMKACPAGSRLPTRQEFMSLLGGCDAEVTSGGSGYCNNCAKSGTCRSMFGQDTKGYWSSSAAGSSSAWPADFSSGRIPGFGKGYGLHMRCVRVGP